MSVYTVHVQLSDASGLKARFVREGFCWTALIFGPLWLLYHRLWWALLGWCVATSLSLAATQFMGLPQDADVLLNVLISLYIALEGNNMLRKALERTGYPSVDVVSAQNLESAERLFYSRWSPNIAPKLTLKSFTPSAEPDILGLFPQKGA